MALSSSASELLLAATKASDGVIMRIETFGGTTVQANQRNFVEGGDARSAAHWRGVVDELKSQGLIEDRSGKGEVFFVTDAGYVAADALIANQPT